ncbi:MAG: MFS transporter [Nevskiaceae bacterium]|nr:MFS transporter [Nevskiaceae bacterium]
MSTEELNANVRHPGDVIRGRAMSFAQIAVVVLCVIVNTVDGFDVLAISFAAPAIAREWGLGPESVCVLLSVGLAGIGAGVLISSFIADAIGRRPVVLAGTVLIGTGMAASAFVNSVETMALCRLLSGMGIGCMVSTLGTLSIEYSAARWRTLAVAAVVLGTPLGGTLGGPVAVYLLGEYGWRAIFLFGASLSVVLFPILLIWLPESIAFLADRQPPNALARINSLATRFSLPALSALPALGEKAASGWRDLTRAPLLKVTLWLCSAYFCYMFSFYFIQSWATSLVTKFGLTDSAGITTSALMNMAGLVGGVLTGYVASRMSLPKLLRVLMLIMAVLIAVFGFLPAKLSIIYAASLALGFFMWSASAAVYTCFALCYPPRLRASGIGLVVTAGRIGSIIGPYAAGRLLAENMSISTVTTLLAVPAVIAALMFGLAKPDATGD